MNKKTQELTINADALRGLYFVHRLTPIEAKKELMKLCIYVSTPDNLKLFMEKSANTYFAGFNHIHTSTPQKRSFDMYNDNTDLLVNRISTALISDKCLVKKYNIKKIFEYNYKNELWVVNDDATTEKIISFNEDIYKIMHTINTYAVVILVGENEIEEESIPRYDNVVEV